VDNSLTGSFNSLYTSIILNQKIAFMAQSMLNYYKRILAKVSFDSTLFTKELKKSIQRLEAVDLEALYDWCIVQFGSRYGEIIQSAFQSRGLKLAI
jgi:hypothetical protein